MSYSDSKFTSVRKPQTSQKISSFPQDIAEDTKKSSSLSDFLSHYPKAYHGTDAKFRQFSLNKSATPMIWFSSDADYIKAGNAGAAGRSIILERRLLITHPAGWKEYDRYGIGELKSLGYNGLILHEERSPTTYAVFDIKRIKTDAQMKRFYESMK
jgi:hypothetical protein